MIVYEVNINVDTEIAEHYRAWLGDHVRELLTLPGFLSAEVFVGEPEGEAQVRAAQDLVVAYRLANHQALVTYLSEQAPAMRAKADEHFAGRYRIHRRVLAPLIEMLRVD